MFTHEIKPLEVEILVAEVGDSGGEHRSDQLFHILYDGTVMDEQRFSVLGGEAEEITQRVESAWRDDRSLTAEDLEVAVLRRTNGRRAFHRIEGEGLEALVPPAPAEGDSASTDEPAT